MRTYSNNTLWNPAPFRRIQVWDSGKLLLDVDVRVVNGCTWLDENGYCTNEYPRLNKTHTVEIIIRSSTNTGTHTFADCICDGRLRPTFVDRCQIGRYLYDSEGKGKGDLLEIANSLAQVSLKVNRDEDGRLTLDVVDQRVFISRPQWGRSWRRPKIVA